MMVTSIQVDGEMMRCPGMGQESGLMVINIPASGVVVR